MSTHDHQVPSGPDNARPRNHTGHPSEAGPPSFWTSKAGLAAIGFLLIAAFLLYSEHRAHALGYLPFLLLLACPLLHVLHGGHGGHTGHGGRSEPSRPARPLPPSKD